MTVGAEISSLASPSTVLSDQTPTHVLRQLPHGKTKSFCYDTTVFVTTDVESLSKRNVTDRTKHKNDRWTVASHAR